MKVLNATRDDVSEWLTLAAEVEYLFGPMVGETSFISALEANVDRKTAFCIRENDGQPGNRLLGGLLWSSNPPIYKIGWLSVSLIARRMGVATHLISHVLNLVQAPAEIYVTTFGEDVPDGRPARTLYQKFGFVPLNEQIANGPEGGSRQKFKLVITS